MPEFKSKNDDLYIDGKKVIEAFESATGWYWFATEISHQQDSEIDGKVYKQDEAKRENSDDIHQSSAGNFMACHLPCRKLCVL